MELLVILGSVALTSLGALMIGRGHFEWSRAALRAAIDAALGFLGTTVLLFFGNVALGVFAVVVARSFGMAESISLYAAGDQTMMALSVLQGELYHSWRESSPAVRGQRR